MSIKFHVPDSLSIMAKDKRLIELNGKTAGECLNELMGLIPGMKDVLFYETGGALKLRSQIRVLVNEDSVDTEGLAREVKDGDEIYIKTNIR